MDVVHSLSLSCITQTRTHLCAWVQLPKARDTAILFLAVIPHSIERVRHGDSSDWWVVEGREGLSGLGLQGNQSFVICVDINGKIGGKHMRVNAYTEHHH